MHLLSPYLHQIYEFTLHVLASPLLDLPINDPVTHNLPHCGVYSTVWIPPPFIASISSWWECGVFRVWRPCLWTFLSITSLWHPISWIHVPRRGMTELWNRHIISWNRIYQTLFLRDCAFQHSPQQGVIVPMAPHFSHTWYCHSFLFSHPGGCVVIFPCGFDAHFPHE